jgi:hypothetical protein
MIVIKIVKVVRIMIGRKLCLLDYFKGESYVLVIFLVACFFNIGWVWRIILILASLADFVLICWTYLRMTGEVWEDNPFRKHKRG